MWREEEGREEGGEREGEGGGEKKVKRTSVGETGEWKRS